MRESTTPQHRPILFYLSIATALIFFLTAKIHAQAVCLPAPRLLTIFPMGAQAGSNVEVTLSGENLDELDGLIFSDPRITATALLDDQRQPIPKRFQISVPAEVQPGLVEAYATARLGVSSSRVFSVGSLAELSQTAPSTSAKDALLIQVGSTTNATMVAREMNYYRFAASTGEQLRIDCISRGIDSKLDPVLTLTNSSGRVLATDRLGSGIEYRVEQAGEYFIKVHDLTFQGGPEYFYRLSLQSITAQAGSTYQLASTRHVGQYSWPPFGFDAARSVPEVEPNDMRQPQQIELPCQLRGGFYPAADVDCFEFHAVKGQQWWIEIASHRLGAPTGPAGLVQRRITTDSGEAWQDVLELKDIASPMKVSSNHYAYDGPPYNGGSMDLIGKLDIPEDGLYRLQLNDLFGGTRDNPNSIYQLVIRPALADFALTGWVKHMELRNGDRNALSKPLALRPGVTIAIEIGAFRRDGFDNPIWLEVKGLPDGVEASTINIPAGQASGCVLLTADVQAPKGLSMVSIVGSAEISGQITQRTCQLASMPWPIRDHWQEFPRPRLSQVVPISVTDSEPHTITVQPSADLSGKVHFQATAKTIVNIPFQLERRCDFSGSVLALNTLGHEFQGNPRFEIPLQDERADVKIDLAKLNIAPGVYTIAFYGAAVAKYQDYPVAVSRAKVAQERAASQVDALKQRLQGLKTTESSSDQTVGAVQAAIEQELKLAEVALMVAENELKAATTRSQPQDIADIVVTRPFTLEVLPAEVKK